jgi:predicted component of type VI protein secretion system
MGNFFHFLKKILPTKKPAIDSGNPGGPEGNEQTIIIDSLNNSTLMSSGLYNYGIGGNEVKLDASEAIQDIQGNKSLIAQKLTDEDPLNPTAVYDLKTVEDVFNHFKPRVSLELEDKQGQTINEDLSFKHLGDFTAKNIIEQSAFLKDLNIQKDQYAKIVKQLKSNKVLKSILENPETRDAFVNVLQSLSEELAEKE